ncbi:All-trans-phytoene synthase [mine drainage metagenome]|uniref:All-trans-phytoene synthase n=1 Tax=mine drainage metagenome TaxID=410659 RepID=A0A1J5QTN8_9ZZZZ
MKPDPASLSLAARDVRRYDRDRFVLALLAPAARREALFCLYAFNSEIARVRELVSEPLMGRIRLQWWQDKLEAIYAGTDRRDHPLADDLAGVIRAHGLPQRLFIRLLQQRQADLEPDPFADRQALTDYVEATASGLAQLSACILGGADEPTVRAAHEAGMAWGLVGLLRALPFQAAQGRVILPGDLLARHGVAAADLLAGRTSPALAALSRDLAQEAAGHLGRARALRAAVPATARPALLQATAADVYLDRLAAAGFDPLSTGWSRPRPRPLLLAWRAWRRRY